MKDGNNTFDPKLNISLLEDLNVETSKLLLPVTIFLGLLCTIGVAGNSLVLYIWSTKLERSKCNTCVLLLAILDLLTCTVGIPMEIYELSNQYYFDNPAACKTFRFLIYISVNSSIIVLLVLACLRYYAVCKPLQVFPIKSRGIILLSVGTGLCLSWPGVILQGTKFKPIKYTNLQGVDCGTDQTFVDSPLPVIYFSVLGVVFIICVILLFGLYAAIAFTIYRRNEEKLGRSQHTCITCISCCRSDPNREDDEIRLGVGRPIGGNVKLTKLFSAITCVFVFSFLPSLVISGIIASAPRFQEMLSDNAYVVFTLSLRTYLINSCANPILYGFMDGRFQTECKKLFTCFKLGIVCNS